MFNIILTLKIHDRATADLSSIDIVHNIAVIVL